MRRLTNYKRGTRQMRAYYYWSGIAYPMNAVRLLYMVSARTRR